MMDPDIQAAEHAVDKLAADPKQMEIYYLREKFALDQASSAYYMEQKGIKKGEKIGEARGIEKGEKIGEARGIEKGEKIGEAKGIEKGQVLQKQVFKMLKQNIPDQQIQQHFNLTIPQLEEYKRDFNEIFH